MDGEPQYSIAFVVFCSLVSGVGGVVVGHWLQVWQARRAEYNELADELFLIVDRTVTPVSGPWVTLPSDAVSLIRRRMAWWQRRRFDSALREYQEVARHTTRDSTGQALSSEPEKMNAALKKLVRVLYRR
jgi:hypothetical protein